MLDSLVEANSNNIENESSEPLEAVIIQRKRDATLIHLSLVIKHLSNPNPADFVFHSAICRWYQS